MHDAKPNALGLTHCRAISEPSAELIGVLGEAYLDEGEERKESEPRQSAGREPAGAIGVAFEAPPAAVGQWLSDLFRERADKAHRLRRLAQELTVLGAPHSLIQRSHSVLRDAIHHTRMLAALTEQFMGLVDTAESTTASMGGLLPLALENARLGCARETLSFSVRMIQAGRATDPRICRTLRRVAHDQVKQAQLSWDVHGWCLSALSVEEARQVEEVLAATFAELALSTGEPGPENEPRSVLGLPTDVELCELSRQTLETLARARAMAQAPSPQARTAARDVALPGRGLPTGTSLTPSLATDPSYCV